MKNLSDISREITEAIGVELDAYLYISGFKRRKGRTLRYKRALNESTQRIDIDMELSPIEDRSAICAVYPKLSVSIDRINEAMSEMFLGNNNSVTQKVDRGILRQPIAFTAEKHESGRWLVHSIGEATYAGKLILQFLQKWTIPFLDDYSTVDEIIEKYSVGDRRVQFDTSQKLRVVAATYVKSGPSAALSLMDIFFSAPGLRHRYSSVFNFFAGR